MRSGALALAVLLVASSDAGAADRATPPAAERLVTLRAKDAAAEEVILSLKKQCGVKNVVIDDDVSGRATFFFRDVPCRTAWVTVLRTYGLAAADYSANVVHVEGPQ